MARPKMHFPDSLVSGIESIHPEGMTERLVRHMKSWVVHGLLLPGSKLPAERDLAAMLQVSRASLRQALKTLEVMGVVQARHGSGTYLTEAAATILQQPQELLIPLRGISFGELYEARRVIEAEAAATAASRVTRKDLSGLRQTVRQMQTHLKAPLKYVEDDLTFHRKIALAAGNSIFAWFQELASTVIRSALEARAQSVALTTLTTSFTEHQTILDAIEANDPEAARAAMLEHLALAKFYMQDQAVVAIRLTAATEGWARAQESVEYDSRWL